MPGERCAAFAAAPYPSSARTSPRSWNTFRAGSGCAGSSGRSSPAECCEKVLQALLPSRPIERGRPGPGLLAHVLVSKYADHLPLYRQSQIYGREGVDLDRSTLGRLGRDAQTALLEPLADLIGRHVMAGPALFADDTPVSVLAPGKWQDQDRATLGLCPR